MSEPMSIAARLRVTLIVGVVLLPLVPLVVWSVAGVWRYPDLVPQRFTDRGLGVIAGGDVVRALGTSLLVSTSVAVLATVIGLSAGRAIAGC